MPWVDRLHGEEPGEPRVVELGELIKVPSLVSHQARVDILQHSLGVRHSRDLLPLGLIDHLKLLLAQPLGVDPLVHTFFSDPKFAINISPGEFNFPPPYCGLEVDSANGFLPVYFLVFRLGCEHPQDVDVVLAVDPQPAHVFLQMTLQVFKP